MNDVLIPQGLTADVGVFVGVVSTVVDEVTQVVLGDAVAISAGILLRCARQGWRKRWRALQEADIINHQVSHVADSSLRTEYHLQMMMTTHKWDPACGKCVIGI